MVAVLLVTTDGKVITVPQQAAKLDRVGLGIGHRTGSNRIFLPPLSAGKEPAYPSHADKFIYHVVDCRIVTLVPMVQTQYLGYST